MLVDIIYDYVNSTENKIVLKNDFDLFIKSKSVMKISAT